MPILNDLQEVIGIIEDRGTQSLPRLMNFLAPALLAAQTEGVLGLEGLEIILTNIVNNRPEDDGYVTRVVQALSQLEGDITLHDGQILPTSDFVLTLVGLLVAEF